MRIINYINGHTGYCRHLTGRAQPPAALSDTDKGDSGKVEAFEDAMDEYIQKQSAIRSIILGSLPEKIQVRVINSRVVSDLWNNLS
jgi:hypothetical protein